MRRRAGAVLLVSAAALGMLIVLDPDAGRAREPGRGRSSDRSSRTAPAAEVLPPAPPSLPKLLPSGVQGTVRDADREEPFAGARVRLFPVTPRENRDPWTEGVPELARPTRETVTDADGRFDLEDDPLRSILVVDAPGCIPVLHFTDRCLCHDIDLSRGTPRRIRALDPEGLGIDAAEALVFSHDGPPRAAVRAGAGGWIDLSLAPEDEIVVRAPGRRSVRCDEPLEIESIVLDAEHRLAGVVVTPAGDPVGGVRLTLRREPWDSRATTRRDGAFAFDGLGPGPLVLYAEPPGRPARGIEVWPGDETMRLVLDAATILGVATLDDGSPAAGARIEASGVEAEASPGGTFSLEVPAGETLLYAEREGPGGVDLYGRADLYLEDGEEVRAILVLAPRVRSRVAVRVLAPHDPPAFAEIRAPGSADTFLAIASTRTDETGRAMLEVSDPPGTRLSLRARCPPTNTRHHPRTDPAAPMVGEATAVSTADGSGPETVIRLRPPLLVTFVFRRADGGPLPADAQVEVEVGDGTWREKGTASRDRCALRCTDGGDSYLLVLAAGYGPVWIDPWVPPPGGGEVEIRLEREVRISGRVVRADGTLAEDPFFQRGLPPRLSRLDSEASHTWDGYGRPLTVSAAPGETLVLSAGEGDEPRWFRRLQVPGDPGTLDLGDIVLLPPAAVRGTVLGPGGEPLGGARISLDPSMTFFLAPFVTRQDGRFDIDAPPWDETLVLVEKDGFACDPIPLSAFREGPRTVRMEPAATLVVEGDLVALGIRRLDGEAPDPKPDLRGRVVVLLRPGRFAVEGKGDGWTDAREVDLHAGRTTRLALGPR